MNGSVVLGCASNETYILGLTVAVCSALQNLSRARQAPVVYVLDGGVRERSWRRLIESVHGVRADCVLHRLLPDMNAFAGLPSDWGSSVMAYARLALPAMIPDPRILYLDSDVIVQGDLSILWDMDLGEAVMAAGLDLTAKDLSGANLPLRELDLCETAPCLNSGVLLIDLQKWREADISAKALRYLRQWPKHALNWDQSALNVVVYGQWRLLDADWNTPAWLADQGSDGCCLDARVLHFVGPNKPWMHGYHKNPSATVFYEWADRTAWRGWRPSILRQACKWAKYRFWKWESELLRRLRGAEAQATGNP
jgi:lipopolysaccharide biosynthesis glycosyltransferase